ncbi:hypothetical protein Z043_105152 [Scleropages formosus]|nr:hypothetical protein Z043_105152 [Scleropages formosus]
MPQTNKAKTAACGPGQQGGVEPPPPPLPPQGEPREQGASAVGAGDNQGDGLIVKSPSDPKQYR